MLSAAVLDRLGALNRRPLAEAELTLPAVAPRRVISPAPVDEFLDRGQEIETAWGPCWRIETRLNELWPQASERLAVLEEKLVTVSEQISHEMHGELLSLRAAYSRRLLYLDLETCGLAGAMAFLVGVIHHDGDAFRLTQWLARDYSEEKAMLQSLWRLAGEKAVLVTFNGKSFDWPLVHDRSTLHHLGRKAKPGDDARPTSDAMTKRDPRPELMHCDVLHHARRRWRSRLPNCRLQTLELALCQRRRTADIAGRDIPAAYHEYVRTKNARQMHSVLHHNALDLVTLLEVSLRVAL